MTRTVLVLLAFVAVSGATVALKPAPTAQASESVLAARASQSDDEAEKRRKKCRADCNSVYSTRIGTCGTVYPPRSRSKEHKECLDKAKSEYDSCLATCR